MPGQGRAVMGPRLDSWHTLAKSNEKSGVQIWTHDN